MRLRTDDRLRRDLKVARGLGISLRRFRGWEPEVRVEAVGEGFRVVREPEFDKEQYELFTALWEYENSLDEHGLPRDETMSPLADPFNPEGTHYYSAKPVRNWATDALEAAQKDPKWSGENFSHARKWHIEKVMR